MRYWLAVFLSAIVLYRVSVAAYWLGYCMNRASMDMECREPKPVEPAKAASEPQRIYGSSGFTVASTTMVSGISDEIHFVCGLGTTNECVAE